MKKRHHIFSSFTVLTFLIFLTGCQTTNPDAKTKKDLMIDKQKQHDNIYKELNEKTIEQGTKADEIREKFGEPDSIFKSGSSTSNFDIWTYEKILISKEDNPDWDTILLYFNNNRLITWKY